MYPDVSLKEARDRRDEGRKRLASDIDPGENDKRSKLLSWTSYFR